MLHTLGQGLSLNFRTKPKIITKKLRTLFTSPLPTVIKQKRDPCFVVRENPKLKSINDKKTWNKWNRGQRKTISSRLSAENSRENDKIRGPNQKCLAIDPQKEQLRNPSSPGRQITIGEE
jgi:hypothetical protein